MKLRIAYFAHSWVSDWNHGNAHFLRGLVRELIPLGHEVHCYEALGSWSLSNLMKSEGERAIEAIDQFRAAYPELNVRFFRAEAVAAEIKESLRDVDVVIIHEWSEPRVVNAVLAAKAELKFKVLLHDTHHRAYTSPRDLLQMNLQLFDGVLAFGNALRDLYLHGFGMPRAWTFHEAADTKVFRPIPMAKTCDLVWIGNWGDDERTTELHEFLLRPAKDLRGSARIVAHGVRYPDQGVLALNEAGIDFRGYLINLSAPLAYAQSKLAIHIPRRLYSNGLSGIPTIRVFEALACGVPLLCSPWNDFEHLFRPGEDYLLARDGDAMRQMISEMLHDPKAREQVAESGLATIRARHTCAHRAEQLTEILEEARR